MPVKGRKKPLSEVICHIPLKEFNYSDGQKSFCRSLLLGIQKRENKVALCLDLFRYNELY